MQTSDAEYADLNNDLDKHFMFDLPLSMLDQEFTAQVLSKPYILTLDREYRNGKPGRIILIKARARDQHTGLLYTFSMSKDEAEQMEPGINVRLVAVAYKNAKRCYLQFVNML